ncbi:MAG TPA: hypothetical protein VNW54_10805 [Granulicella sp.]|jgi:hypothetical protein|nr:hypothetical protein [Granulicella sp.]
MISPHASLRFTRTATVALALALGAGMLSGCTSKQDAAIEKAKQQANATGQPQQITSTDKNGNTTTTTVEPLQPGQSTQAITTTVTPASPVPANTPATVPGGNAANSAAPSYPSGQSDQSGQYANQPGQYANQPGQAATQPNQYATQSGPAPDQSGQYANQPVPPPPGNPPAVQPADVRIPAGTPLVIRINQHISVKTSRAGDRFSGAIQEPVIDRNRRVLIPRGAPVEGVIDEAHRRGRFKGSSILELRLVSLSLNGVRYPLDTNDLSRTKKGKGKRSAAFIGGGAGAGMLIGGIASGGVGLLVGGLAGGGAGAVAGGFTGNRDIEIPAESIVRFQLAEPLVLQAP